MNNEIFKNNLFFRQLFFLIALISIGLLIALKLGSILGSFLGAITVYIILRPSLFKLTEKKEMKPWLAASLLLISSIIVFFGIFAAVFQLIVSEIPSLHSSIIMNAITKIVNEINDFAGYEILSKKIISESHVFLTKIVSNILSGTYSFALNFILMFIILYFMLANGRKIENILVEYSPFHGENLNMIKEETKGIIYSNAVGIPIIMLVQGIAACIGYWIVGLDNIFFWAFLTAIFGLLPVVGSGIIWLPVAVYCFISGEIWQGVVVLIWGFIVISNIDNVCRMILMKKMSDTHPLIVIFGVMLGIPLFGFWGIIFGPLLISGFLLLIKIYYIEFGINSNKSKLKKQDLQVEDTIQINTNALDEE